MTIDHSAHTEGNRKTAIFGDDSARQCYHRNIDGLAPMSDYLFGMSDPTVNPQDLENAAPQRLRDVAGSNEVLTVSSSTRTLYRRLEQWCDWRPEH